MAKRIRDYVKYTVQELERYTETKGSCVKRISTTFHLNLPAYGLASMKNTLLNIIAQKKIGLYDASVQGIILDVKNIKILGNTGAIRFDDPKIHINVKADNYVFQPHIGAIVRGVVRHVSSRQIGVIIYRVFSVSIRLKQKVCSETIELNSEIEFRIKKFDLENMLPYIEGELVAREIDGDEQVSLEQSHLRMNESYSDSEDSDDNKVDDNDKGLVKTEEGNYSEEETNSTVSNAVVAEWNSSSSNAALPKKRKSVTFNIEASNTELLAHTSTAMSSTNEKIASNEEVKIENVSLSETSSQLNKDYVDPTDDLNKIKAIDRSTENGSTSNVSSPIKKKSEAGTPKGKKRKLDQAEIVVSKKQKSMDLNESIQAVLSKVKHEKLSETEVNGRNKNKNGASNSTPSDGLNGKISKVGVKSPKKTKQNTVSASIDSILMKYKLQNTEIPDGISKVKSQTPKKKTSKFDLNSSINEMVSKFQKDKSKNVPV